jgi:hypothetical protein
VSNALAVMGFILALASLILVTLLLFLRRRPPTLEDLLAEKLRATFIVTLLDGSTFHGLLTRADERFVVLTDAFTVLTGPGGGTQETPVDGELLLPRAQVSYLQRP